MYELIKHFPSGSSVTVFVTCEYMVRMRFAKSAALLKQHASLELKHDGKLIDSRKAPHYGPIDSDDVSDGAMP